jgi:malonate transporter and related proteins
MLVFGQDGLPAAVIATLSTACVLFLPPIAGLAVGLTGLPLPLPLDTSAKLLGGTASPCALVRIGGLLARGRGGAGDWRLITRLVVLELPVRPAVTTLLTFAVFDVPPPRARAAALPAALPIGSRPVTTAKLKLYGLQAGVTSGAILVSHVVSVATVSALAAWLS